MILLERDSQLEEFVSNFTLDLWVKRLTVDLVGGTLGFVSDFSWDSPQEEVRKSLLLDFLVEPNLDLVELSELLVGEGLLFTALQNSDLLEKVRDERVHIGVKVVYIDK